VHENPHIHRNPTRNGVFLIIKNIRFCCLHSQAIISTSLSYHHLFLAHMTFLTTISSVHEPQNFQEDNSQDI